MTPARCPIRFGIPNAGKEPGANSLIVAPLVGLFLAEKRMRKVRNTKQLGELGELLFACNAALRGLGVSWPHGASERYDCLIDNGRRISRVQVKVVGRAYAKNAYSVGCGRQSYTTRGVPRKCVPYSPKDVDCLALYVVLENVWFLFPVQALGKRVCVALFTGDHPKRKIWAQYEANWELLTKGGICRPKTKWIDRIFASAEAEAILLLAVSDDPQEK